MKTFEELGLVPDLIRAIDEIGYESPMPIQEAVIPYLLGEGNDVIALAQTGTGKTAAYGLPLLQKIDPSREGVQAVVLSPTRELCLQIAGDLKDYSKYLDGVRVLAVYGGADISSQIRALRRGVQIIVATPGRLIDLMERGAAALDNVDNVVLDEADEMLNMGFVDDINDILTHVPEERKMLMFSATMPPEIAKIAARFMHNPQEYVIGTRNEGAENVRHIYYLVHARDKYLALKRIADYNPAIYGIIFCRTRRETQEIADKLIVDGYNADSLHGDLSQAQRDAVMKKFRERNLQLLVATDVAARGLDVSDLTHVINYGLPDDVATYTHRSGRTGRAGKTGVSVSIVHSREKGKIKDIEKRIGKQFELREVPTPERIIERQLYNLADRIEKVKVNEDVINNYIPGIQKKLEWLSGEDLIKRVLSLEFNRLLEYYKDAPKLDIVTEKKGKEKGSKKHKSGAEMSQEEKDRRTGEPGYDRVYVNVGKSDGFFASDLIGLINETVQGQRIEVGRIDLMPGYSLFDVRKGDGRRVADALRNSDFYGKRIYSEIADLNKDYAAENRGKGGGKYDSKSEGRRRDRRGKGGIDRRTRRDQERGFSKREARSERGKAAKKERPEGMHGNYDKFMKKKK